jgi:hypothetical protein
MSRDAHSGSIAGCLWLAAPFLVLGVVCLILAVVSMIAGPVDIFPFSAAPR